MKKKPKNETGKNENNEAMEAMEAMKKTAGRRPQAHHSSCFQLFRKLYYPA